MTPVPPLGSRDSAVGLFGLGMAEHPASEDPLGLLHNEGISTPLSTSAVNPLGSSFNLSLFTQPRLIRTAPQNRQSLLARNLEATEGGYFRCSTSASCC